MQDQLSAVVLMRPAAGGTVGEVATAETAELLLPDPGNLAAAQAFFRGIGFEVVGTLGPSFSIVGPRELFERTFGQPLAERPDGGVTTAEGDVELPLGALQADVARPIQAVTFTPPPAFGPTEFH